MTELRRYWAEEVAEDHADGIITRREAMRRLGLLGVTGAAATSLLASFSGGAEAARAREVSGRARGASRGAREVDWAPAAAEQPRGGVLVIHENRGLVEHIRTVAGRFAASGYSALAIDLLSEEGGTGSFPGEAEVAAALAQIPPERHEADMQAAVTELERRVPRKGVAAIGFCFGGAMVWRLLTSGETRLAAAAPFYGPFPEGGTFERSKTAVLGIYGGLDSRANAPRPTTPFSTTPVPALTLTRRLRPTTAFSTGSIGSSLDTAIRRTRTTSRQLRTPTDRARSERPAVIGRMADGPRMRTPTAFAHVRLALVEAAVVWRRVLMQRAMLAPPPRGLHAGEADLQLGAATPASVADCSLAWKAAVAASPLLPTRPALREPLTKFLSLLLLRRPEREAGEPTDGVEALGVRFRIPISSRPPA